MWIFLLAVISFPSFFVFPRSFAFLQTSRPLPKQPDISLQFLQVLIKQAKARVQGWCWQSVLRECEQWEWRDLSPSCCWSWVYKTHDRCSWGGLSWRTCGWTKHSDNLMLSWSSKTQCRFAKISFSCQGFPPSPQQVARMPRTSRPARIRPPTCQWTWCSYPLKMH